MKLVSYNMQGMGNLSTVLYIANTVRPAFIALQETMLTGTNINSLTLALPGYKVFTKCADNYLTEEDMILKQHVSFHGVALAVELDIISDIEEVQIEDPNIILVKYKGSVKSLLVGCLYLPTRGQNIEFPEAVDKLGASISNVQGDDILLMGDINCDKTSERQRISVWEKFVERNELTDHVRNVITHRHHVTGKENELDRFLSRGLTLTVAVEDGGGAASDHLPISATVEVQVWAEDPEAETFRKCETRVKLDQLDPDQFKQATDELADKLREIEGVSLDDFNGILSRSIWATAIQLTGQDKYNEKAARGKRRKRRRAVKVDKALYKDLKQKRLKYLRRGKVVGSREWLEYTQARKSLRGAISESVRNEEKELQEKIVEAAETRSPKIYSLLRKIKHGHEAANVLPSELSGYGRSYGRGEILKGFRDLFEVQGLMDEEDRYDQERLEKARDLIMIRNAMRWEDQEPGLRVDREIFNKALQGLAAGKAQDSCGLSNDVLKMCGTRMHDLIYDYVVMCFNNNDFGGLTRNYGKGTIIVKKPQKPINVIGNWRKIVSNNVLNNLIQYILQQSIEKEIQKVQTQYQMGFTPGVPVMHAVLAREEILSLSKKNDWTVFLLILDLKSCFPRIPREQLLHLLSEVASPQEWALVSQIYMNTWSDVRVQSMRTNDLRSNIGTVEGGILSANLLKLFMSVLLTMLERAGFNSNIDFVTGRVTSGQICVADDVLLYTWDEETARNMLHICEIWSNRYRAMFSPEKSVCLIQRAKTDFKVYNAFRIYGEALDIVNEAEHLGTPVVPGDNSEALTMGRLAKTRRTIYSCISFFDKKNFLTAAVKLDLWVKIFKPTLIFSHETTNLKASQARRLSVLQHKMLTAIFGLTKRASKSKLRLLTGQAELTSEIWKLRFTALNGVFTRRTLARRFVLLNLQTDNNQSWSFKTAAKLGEWADHDPIELLRVDKETFKTGAKGLTRREDLRAFQQELGETPYLPSSEVLDTVNPMILTDFKETSKRELTGWAKAVTGDFIRLYDGEACPLCGLAADTAVHLMSSSCIINREEEVVRAREDIRECARVNFPHHPLAWDGLNDFEMVQFMINPVATNLGQLRIQREDLQYSGLDRLIRRFLAAKVKARYEIIKARGLRDQFTSRRRGVRGRQ